MIFFDLRNLRLSLGKSVVEGAVVARIAVGDAEGATRAMDVHLAAFEELVRARGNIDQQVIRAADWS